MAKQPDYIIDIQQRRSMPSLKATGTPQATTIINYLLKTTRLFRTTTLER